jgi:hypothetical protein
MKKLSQFLQYNNFVPVALAVLILGGTGTFAATPAGQQALLASAQSVVSVDNTFLIALDVESFEFGATVTAVEETAEYYTVSYDLETVDIVNDIWQPVTKQQEMKVYKAILEDNDLGLYVQEELSEVVEHHRQITAQAQKNEQEAGASVKKVATVYSGLVGQFLSTSEEEFESYNQVVYPEVVAPDEDALVTMTTTSELEAQAQEAQDQADEATEEETTGEETNDTTEEVVDVTVIDEFVEENAEETTEEVTSEETTTEETSANTQEESTSNEESAPVEEPVTEPATEPAGQ